MLTLLVAGAFSVGIVYFVHQSQIADRKVSN